MINLSKGVPKLQTRSLCSCLSCRFSESTFVGDNVEILSIIEDEEKGNRRSQGNQRKGIVKTRGLKDRRDSPGIGRLSERKQMSFQSKTTKIRSL